jgi:NADH:ubiquinone oxidoreductase subunit 5 (subunit L)/multisubunit Na+/H+ antiporter MnhA subunit
VNRSPKVTKKRKETKLLPYVPWLCWIAPTIGALLVPLLDTSAELKRYRGYLGVSTIGLSTLFALFMLPEALRGEIIDLKLSVPPPLEIGVLVDPLSVLMVIIVCVIGLAVAVFSHGYMGGNSGLTRFWFIMQLFISGYIIVVLADNFLFLFIGWEIVGLCCTYLTSYEYRNQRKVNLGFKVNNVLRVGDIALLIFILTIYVHAGTFNFIELSENIGWVALLSHSGLLLVSSFLFLGGVVGKAAQFPLHEWLPDMLVGTPSSSNALTECLAGPYLMARALPMFRLAYTSGFSELSYFFMAAAWVGAATALLTALVATAQRHPQRIMAYSISSIIGFMLTALGLAGLNNNMPSGYLTGTTILTIDAFVSALLILSTVFVSYALGSEDLYNMGGFHNKLAYRGMEVAVFAMINIPPFSGFWLSNWVQSAALELSSTARQTGESFFIYSGYGLFAFLILTGGVTAFYCLRLMGLIYNKNLHRRKVKKIPGSMTLAFAGLLMVTMVLDLAVPLLIPLFNDWFLPVVGEVVFRNVFDVILYIVPSMSTVMTILALIVGGYISTQLYITRKIDPSEIMNKYRFIAKIHAFFLNRCYIDFLYRQIGYFGVFLSRKLYKNVETEGIKTFRIHGINEFFDIGIRWLSSLSQWIYPSVELGGFERLNRILTKYTEKLSDKIRITQTGVLSINILLMLIGAVALAALLLLGGIGRL